VKREPPASEIDTYGRLRVGAGDFFLGVAGASAWSRSFAATAASERG